MKSVDPNIQKGKKGFTLIEVLVTVVIAVIVATGIMQLLIACAQLADLSGNMTSAMTSVQNKMEEIRNHTYSSIVTDYASGGTPGNTFDILNPTGKGAIYIDSSNANLLKITISASWKNDNGRIIGEDLDLDGVVDIGENADSNNQLDSITYLQSNIALK